MKIYVAGSSAELDRASNAMAFVRGRGHEITHDWVADIQRERIEGGREDHELGPHEQMAFARADLQGVTAADLLWLLVPDTTSTGAWVELGWALARSKKIIASGKHAAGNIFCSLAHQTFSGDQLAREYLRGLDK